MNKFGNTKVQYDGFTFGSKLEASVYQYLKLREKAGELQIVQLQDHVHLMCPTLYIPDFKCVDLKTGEFFWVEAKGFANDRWPAKKRGWKNSGPGRLEIWTGTHQRPTLSETITPKAMEEE